MILEPIQVLGYKPDGKVINLCLEGAYRVFQTVEQAEKFATERLSKGDLAKIQIWHSGDEMGVYQTITIGGP